MSYQVVDVCSDEGYYILNEINSQIFFWNDSVFSVVQILLAIFHTKTLGPYVINRNQFFFVSHRFDLKFCSNEKVH